MASAPTDDILIFHSPPIRELAEQLRAVILSTVPDARQKVYPGWRAIGYTHPSAGYFCAIFPHDAIVRLALEWGVLLPDPSGLLTGSGSQVRYVDCAPEAAIPGDAICQLLLDCLALPEKRSERLALVQAGARPL